MMGKVYVRYVDDAVRYTFMLSLRFEIAVTVKDILYH